MLVKTLIDLGLGSVFVAFLCGVCLLCLHESSTGVSRCLCPAMGLSRACYLPIGYWDTLEHPHPDSLTDQE